LFGAAVKIILILQLASLPQLGMTGAIWAIGLNTILVTLLHAVSIMRSIKMSFPWKDLFKVITAMIIMAGIVQYVYIHLPVGIGHMALRFIAACSAGILAYLILLVMMKLIDRDDLTRIPLIKRWFPASKRTNEQVSISK